MENNKYLFILIGKSGSGKGAQALNIVNYFGQVNPDSSIKHVTTGAGFRDFIQKDNYMSKLSKRVVESGGLMPSFLSVWNWTNILLNTLNENDNLIVDGAPRKMDEARALNDLANFLNFNKIFILYFDISDEVARQRLSERGRDDDNDISKINSKLNWFEEDVLPVIEYYKQISSGSDRFKFIHLNGEKSVEEIKEDIINKIFN